MRISQSELLRIQRAQESERTWWGEKPCFKTCADIRTAVAEGILKEVRDGMWYQISANCALEHRALTPTTLALLEHVSREWAEEASFRGSNVAGKFLLVSSLTRPSNYQQELVEKGFPAVPDSSHERGYAFDISYRWFYEYHLAGEEALRAVLMRLQKEGAANVIDEHEIRVFHVSPSPFYGGATSTLLTAAE